jgi:hypothetical protein
VKERRRHSRYVLRRRIWCEGDRFTVSVSSIDASEGGIQLRTSIPPPPGTRLRVSFEEPGHGKIVADVEVVWAKPGKRSGGMGLKIVSFVEGQEHWAGLVAARKPQPA